MIKTIKTKENEQLGIIIPSISKNLDPIKFFTQDSDDIQVGIINRPNGHLIEPHFHLNNERKLNSTSEVLIILEGELKVNFYDFKMEFVQSEIIKTGDVLVLFSGGHGFEILQKTKMIEVKQGPYMGELDKTKLS